MGVFMNFRKLITYLTMGTAAAMPLAVAQNPTILQGSYISNVFGNSNFVLNPNAQTNTANVTVSSATVTRSTTTPLVATTEFTITTSTATGYADWATRTFDAGMKNQNCEARFTYRGFSVGSTTVQIRQGSNTVAQLTLTASTDPRIASINFPCGDLSSATTLRVQQATASLTGTNELSGLYLGLATNQANVAQAEFYGSMIHYGNGSCIWSGNGGSAIAADNDCTTYTKSGANLQPSTNVPAIQFTPMKSGNYQISVSGKHGTGSLDYGYCTLYQNGAIVAPITSVYFAGSTGREMRGSITSSVELQSGTAYTFDIRCNANSSLLARDNNGEAIVWTVHRFPTSSELVVTPERQNVWGGVVYNDQNQTLFSGSAQNTTFSTFTNATWNQPSRLRGKAAVTTTNSGNDLGFSIPNLPVGNYKLEISGLINTTLGGPSNFSAALCNFKIFETTTSTDVGRQTHQDGSTYATNTGSRDFVNSFSGIFNNTSLATRNFVLQANKASDNTVGNVAGCQAFSMSNNVTYSSNITFLITPLDQPSNSALYVQGPVLGAQTGAAIPAGYVGQTQTALSNVTTANIDTVTNLSGTDVTLQPGTYMLFGTIGGAGGVCSNATSTLVYGRIRDGSNNLISESVISYSGSSALRNPVTGTLVAVVNVTVATVYRLTVYWANDGGTCSIPSAAVFYASQSRLNAIRLN